MPSDDSSREASGFQDPGGNAAATPNMNADPLADALDQQSQSDTIEHAETEDTGVTAKDDATYPGGPGSRNTSAPAGAEIGGATTPMGAVAGKGSPTCPPEYPVKADQGTNRFHVPGRRTYDQVIPTWCFADEAAALNAGYAAQEEQD